VSLFVLDASVAAKWFLPPEKEPLAQEAWNILKQFQGDELRLIVPDLFWAELTNILWKVVRQGRCERSAAESALAMFRRLQLPTMSSANLIELAFSLACAQARTVYDCIYFALALESKATLLTADEKLANALAGSFPIKFLGAVSF
jgi:predicted nucleic acid-binding protein